MVIFAGMCLPGSAKTGMDILRVMLTRVTMLSARDAMLTDSRWDESARVYSNWYGHSWDDTLNPARKRWCMGRLSSECQEDEGSHVEFEDAMRSDSRWDETARLYKNSYGHSWGDTFDPVRKRWYRCSWDWPRWRYQAKQLHFRSARPWKQRWYRGGHGPETHVWIHGPGTVHLLAEGYIGA